MTDTMPMKDYIDHMTTRGLFSDDAPFAEHSPAILHAFFNSMRRYDYDGLSVPVTCLMDRYGFFIDAIDNERIGINWANSTWMVDTTLAVSREQFMADLPALRDALGDQPVMTDTFAFINGFLPEGTAHDITALYSPVARFDGNYETYVESLSQERRKKYRRFVKDFDTYALTFSLTDEPLTSAELSFAWDQLSAKWGEDSAQFAFAQTIWAHAVSQARPIDVLFMRVRDKDRLVFVQTVLKRRGGWVTQSIFRDNETFYDGIAPYTDFKTIEALCTKGPSYLDPSCRTGFEDPDSIGIAKRATVNDNFLKPVFLAGTLPSPFIDYIANPSAHGKPA